MSGANGVRVSDIPLGPFRERFEQMESGGAKDAATTVAMRLGWYHKGYPDGTRVRRLLGLRLDSGSFKAGRFYPPKYRESVTPKMARLLCDALDMDPVEAGL